MLLLGLAVCGLALPIAYHAEDRIFNNFPRYDWEPTIAPLGARYLANAACAACHVAESSLQPNTPMGKALERPEESAILREYPRLALRIGPYFYEIHREGGTAVYSVSDGKRMIVTPILAAVGSGVGTVGQTYVLMYNGILIESEVTYYDRIQGLDITMGHQGTKPASLESALGTPLPWREESQCFGCHATAAVSGYHMQLDKMIPGIGCEGCHGAGADHVAAVAKSQFDDLHIFNPGSLPPGDLNDFCGSCHRTLLSVKLLGVRGVQNVRFEGYRLARSRCYSPDDRRISCIACHNPHEPLERQARVYDTKCLACHPSDPAGSSTSSTPERCRVPSPNRVASIVICPRRKFRGRMPCSVTTGFALSMAARNILSNPELAGWLRPLFVAACARPITFHGIIVIAGSGGRFAKRPQFLNTPSHSHRRTETDGNYVGRTLRQGIGCQSVGRAGIQKSSAHSSEVLRRKLTAPGGRTSSSGASSKLAPRGE